MASRPVAAPPGCGDDLREHARLEWWLGRDGDPASLAEEFLAGHGLDVRDLTRPAPGGHPRVCGATLYASAAACAALADLPGGRPGPVRVPDLVVVVWRHEGARGTAGTSGSGAPGPAGDPGWRVGPWRASWSSQQHREAVAAVRRAIGRGDLYQANLVGHAAAPCHGDPTAALARVAGLPGARYAGILRGHGWALACASPETLVAVCDGRVVTRPIKGTRPATAAGRAELLASAKERAEHVMIVDLERNDLSRVARTGSVRADELFAVRRWCDLWQAESLVSAQLDGGVGLARLLRAVCPGGSVTGAPKRAALELVASLEPVGRGPSMGAWGWVGHDRVDLGLTIRTAAADTRRLHLWAGGGITWGSDPAAEVAEAAAKAAPLRAALAGAQPAQPSSPNTAPRNTSARSNPDSV